ncbi:MAG: DUF1826 domain-containing protein [Candidatus Sericytochromatia bacterium]|nr:DUF1826 domain-containing protein [Candidatus Sericytochromatia bacterium]
MSFAVARPLLAPGPKEAAALLAAAPGRPLELARPEAEAERLRDLLADADLGQDWAATGEVAAGLAPWPVAHLEEGLLDAWQGAGCEANTGVVEALVQDALEQAAWLCALAGRVELPLRGCLLAWAVHRGQPCRRLHRDTLPLRIVTAYVGAGTEWVLDEGLLGAEEVPDAGALHRCAPLTPLVLPGKLAWGAAAPGIIHRSPPLDGSSPRLVLRVDAVPAP